MSDPDEIAALGLPADMAKALSDFDKNAGGVTQEFVRSVNGAPIPKKIYHYTDDKGLKGILESGTIWLTDIFSLNDPSELAHSFSLASELIRQQVDHKAKDIFAKEFVQFATKGGLQAAAHFFVASFSARRDDLSQWRAYADDGKGYVLEFDTQMLEQAYVASDSQHNSTFDVTYREETLRELFGKIVDMAMAIILMPDGRGLELKLIGKFMAHLSLLLTLHILEVAIYFKHGGYENEREYRFFQIFRFDQPVPQVKYRSRPYSLVRYREFEWRKVASAALTGIILGPASDEAKARAYAADCLRAFHTGTVAIEKSSIPYRSTQ